MVNILGLGDNTVDIYVDQDVQFPGGNAVNVAVFCKRLGADASYLGCIGRDLFGNLVRDALTLEGVGLERLRLIDEPNGWSAIRHVDGDRVFDGVSFNPTNPEWYQLQADDFAYMETFDLVHSCRYSKLEAEIENISKAAKVLSFDFTDEFDDAYLRSIAPYVQIAILSDSNGSERHAEALCKDVAKLGPHTVVVTRGENGSIGFHKGRFHRQTIVETEVVDTLGAGDGFIAGLLMALMNNEAVPYAMQKGAEYASMVCTFHGAFGHGIPLVAGQSGVTRLEAQN